MTLIFDDHKKYKCTKGHKWQLSSNQSSGSLTIQVMPNTEVLKNLCPYCLSDKIKEFISDVGRVKEIKKDELSTVEVQNKIAERRDKLPKKKPKKRKRKKRMRK